MISSFCFAAVVGWKGKMHDNKTEEKELNDDMEAISLSAIVGDQRGFIVGAFRRTP